MMDEKRQVRLLRMCFCLCYCPPLLLVIFCEFVLPFGCWVIADEVFLYWAKVAGVAAMLLCVPLALKLMALRPVADSVRKAEGASVPRYVRWSLVRLGLLWLAGLLNIVLYYLTLESSCAFCTLVAVVASAFCWPSLGRLEQETGKWLNDSGGK